MSHGHESNASTTRYDPTPGLAAVGSHVELELMSRYGESELLSVDIVADEAANLDAGFLGAGTPLARAIMGRPVGSRIPYRMGDLVEVRIVAIERSEREADTSAAASREAATRDAVDRAALDETIQLALTFSSKWGDYDPAALERDDEEEEEEG